MAKRTISKGSRLKLRDKYDREFFVLITGLLVASPVGFFYKNFETLPPKVLAIYAVGILLIAFSVAFGLLILLYHKFLFFSKNNYKRLLLNYVVKHNLVEKETVKDEKGSHEKLKLAPIYLKQPNTYELHTYFPIDGGVHQEKFLDLADGLETTFFADYQEQNFILAEMALRGFISKSPKEYYEEGVRSSMRFVADNTPDDVMFHHNRKITDAYIQEYLGNQGVKFASDFQEQLSQIIWQKYILTFLQTPYNAFFEYRRTGVPNIPINPKSNRNIPSDKMPLRWMYPSEELDYNMDNVSKSISDQYGGSDDYMGVMWILK